MDCHGRGGAVAGLPDDPLVEILSRVPVKSLCRSKCVSKAWRDLIADPLHRRKLPQTLEGFFCSEIRGDAVGGGDAAAADGGDGDGSGNNVPDYGYGHFVDLIGRAVPPVDPSFSFLKELPGMEQIRILHSCNGLLLLFRRDPVGRDTLGYVVCSPATEEWVAVPSSGWYVDAPEESDEEDSHSDMEIGEHTFLIFDPAVSSHFNIVQFFKIDEVLYDDVIQSELGLRTYSSETGVWTDRSVEWRRLEEGQNLQWVRFGSKYAFVNGMLHLFVVYGIQKGQLLIVAVDCEGKKRRVISWPNCEGKKHSVISWLPQTSYSFRLSHFAYVGQSQGRLHCINEDIQDNSTHITIWILEDYDKEEWVMKHSVSTLQLFGRFAWLAKSDYSVVAIHPDRNLVYIIQRDRRLISYNMDSKEVHALCVLGHGDKVITPYVPYFSESSVLSNKR